MTSVGGRRGEAGERRKGGKRAEEQAEWVKEVGEEMRGRERLAKGEGRDGRWEKGERGRERRGEVEKEI